MIAAVASHCFVSYSIRFRPARVIVARPEEAAVEGSDGQVTD